MRSKRKIGFYFFPPFFSFDSTFRLSFNRKTDSHRPLHGDACANHCNSCLLIISASISRSASRQLMPIVRYRYHSLPILPRRTATPPPSLPPSLPRPSHPLEPVYLYVRGAYVPPATPSLAQDCWFSRPAYARQSYTNGQRMSCRYRQ